LQLPLPVAVNFGLTRGERVAAVPFAELDGAAKNPLWVNLRRTQREHMSSNSAADNRHQRALSAAAAPAILPIPPFERPPAPKEAP